MAIDISRAHILAKNIDSYLNYDSNAEKAAKEGITITNTSSTEPIGNEWTLRLQPAATKTLIRSTTSQSTFTKHLNPRKAL